MRATTRPFQALAPAFDVEHDGAIDGQHELGEGMAVCDDVGAIAAQVQVGEEGTVHRRPV